ncbi:MAG: PEP-CTERM sorting domain-containing protein [Planctomycetota bacterium]
MKRGKIVFSKLVVLIIAFSCVSASFAGMVEVKEMSFTFSPLPYYSSKTLGFGSGTAGNTDADVAVPTAPGYTYSVRDAVVTLSNMALTGGVGTPTGTFAGPGTLTVTGRLLNDVGTDLTGDTILLVAQMDSPLVLGEIFSQYTSSVTPFTTTSGALFDGVVDGADTLFLEDFAMGLWGHGVDVLFGETNSMSPTTAGVQITTDAIPEPATMGLLSMGMLILSRRRKKV